MAAAFTLVDSWDTRKKRHVIGTVVFSGSYTTGGDTLDLTGKGILASAAPIDGRIEGQAGFKYEWAPGTAMANGKVLIRINDAGGANAPMAQHSAASIVAGVTGDTVKAQFVFNKE